MLQIYGNVATFKSSMAKLLFLYHFRSHRLHAVHRCVLLLQMSHAAWYVCLSVGLQDSWWNISVSCLVILAASFIEVLYR